MNAKVDQMTLDFHARPRWAECGMEEKVERLRDTLTELQRSFRWMSSTAYRLDMDFREHFHTVEGAPAVPIQRRHGEGVGVEAGSEHDPLA